MIVALKIESSVLAGLATATVVYGVYQAALPSQADIRSLESNNADVMAAERTAEWASAGIVSGVSLIARDPTIFVIGGTVVVALAWMNRYANAVKPSIRSLVPEQMPRTSQADAPQEYATPRAPTYEPTF